MATNSNAVNRYRPNQNARRNAYDDRPSMLSGLGATLRTVVDSNGLQRGLAGHQAVALWSEVAGEQVAGVCQAESAHEGILYVKAKSSAWANELTFHKPELIRKLAMLIGNGVINDIHFSSGSRLKTRRANGKANRGIELERDGSQAVCVLPPMDPAANRDPKLKLQLLVDRKLMIDAWRRENGWIECSRCSALYLPKSGKNTGFRSSRIVKKSRNSAVDGVCEVCEILMNR